MLVLSRKAGQALLIGKDIEITVLRVDGDQVRIGVKAPTSITILRRELQEEVRSETAAAKLEAQKAPQKLSDLKALSQQLTRSKTPR
ncbi:MAG: carbon storage regulator CsrA [Planctomycetota bacterium]|nr:carbon storage regulator CsrA [Planctomycetota bacterium]